MANTVYYTISITNFQYREGYIHRHSVCLTASLFGGNVVTDEDLDRNS